MRNEKYQFIFIIKIVLALLIRFSFFNWLMLEIFIIQYLFIPLNMQDILTLMIRTILYQNILY